MFLGSTMSDIERLLGIGFEFVGVWEIDSQGNISFELNDLESASNVLYAFVNQDDVKYIGKTVRKLKERLYGYQKPTQTQRTNIKNNERIAKLLGSGETVKIYALPNNGLLHYGEFQLNIAAGLEDSLVGRLKPAWNDTGK